jgi:3-oxoadipate CoA-transferase alpha subunit
LIDKQVASVAEAVADIPDGATVMVGGFGASGSPVELIHALIEHGVGGLTVINNNTGNGEVGLAALIGNGQVRKMICSFPRSSQSRVFPKLYKEGRIELELVPQGTLAERAPEYRRSLRRQPWARFWQRARRHVISMDAATCWSHGSRPTMP